MEMSRPPRLSRRGLERQKQDHLKWISDLQATEQALRARVAGLETSAARLRADLDLTQGAVAEEVKARVATEQRAATLQAEVERLQQEAKELREEDSRLQARCAQWEKDWGEELDRRKKAEYALAESERKREELLPFARHVADKDCDHQTPGSDRQADCYADRAWAKPCMPCRAYRVVRGGA